MTARYAGSDRGTVRTVYIGIGSNIDPELHVATVLDELAAWLDDCELSPCYRSPSVGFDGAAFINAVCRGRTIDATDRIVTRLRAIEAAHGRDRSAARFGPRTLDLDLLLDGDRVQDVPVPLPRPGLLDEAFTLQPLADLAGDALHPAFDATFRQLRDRARDRDPAAYAVLKPVDRPGTGRRRRRESGR